MANTKNIANVTPKKSPAKRGRKPATPKKCVDYATCECETKCFKRPYKKRTASPKTKCATPKKSPAKKCTTPKKSPAKKCATPKKSPAKAAGCSTCQCIMKCITPKKSPCKKKATPKKACGTTPKKTVRKSPPKKKTTPRKKKAEIGDDLDYLRQFSAPQNENLVSMFDSNMENILS